MKRNPPRERGSAEIRVTLKNGRISILHGETGEVLHGPIEVPPGTWDEMFCTILSVLEDRQQEYADSFYVFNRA